MSFEIKLTDILEIADAESVNATDSTMGAAGARSSKEFRGSTWNKRLDR
ncbi:hypothetical protein [Burkholderia multivorans]